MKRFTRWTIALAASVLLATPAVITAQQTPPTTPTPTEPTQTPAQPTTPSTTPAPGATQEVDAESAKRHLTAARDSLSQLTQLPAAAQLTGDARTQVSQLITNFNELITTNTEWRASYAKVVANLGALIGDQKTDESPATPTSSTPGAVGTSGTVAIDPAIRAKLVEFRAHLVEFEKAAGGQSASTTATPAASASASMPSNTAAPGSTSEPKTSAASTASAAASESGTPGATGTAGAGAPTQTAGTSGTSSAATPSPTASASTSAEAEPQSRQAPERTQTTQRTESKQEGHSEAIRHIEAIETILGGRGGDKPAGTSGTAGERASGLDRDQIEQIRTHLTELRRLVTQAR